MSQRRRIGLLYVVGSLEVGGAERQIVELCRRLDSDRFSPEVATLGMSGAMAAGLKESGVRVYAFRATSRVLRSARDPRRAISALRGVFRLRKLIRQRRPAILHAFLPEACVVAAAATKKNGPPSLIVAKRSLVETISWAPPYLALARFANRRAGVIHVNSEAVRRDVIAREGGPREKVRLVYNGVDTGRFRSPAEPRPGPRARVGMLANFIAYKGHREILQAVNTLHLDFPFLELWLWGRDGPSSGALAELCRAWGLESRVRFLGVVEDPAEALRQVDVFVSASYAEGFSNSILEAMATGLPVIATAVGGSVEQVEDGKTGVLVPPRDPEALRKALKAVISDDAFAARLGLAARRRAVERFSVERMVRDMASLYEDLAPRL